MDALSSISDSNGTSWASDVRSALSDGCWWFCHDEFHGVFRFFRNIVEAAPVIGKSGGLIPAMMYPASSDLTLPTIPLKKNSG